MPHSPAPTIEIARVRPEPEPWPDLIPLDTPRLPRLAPDVLPGWAGAFAAELAASTETPPELAIGLILATCSAAAARRLRVLVQPGHIEPANLWVAVALPPGNRKSAVQSAATAPLLAWERDAARDIEPEIRRTTSTVATMQARVKELRARAAKKGDMGAADEASDIEAAMPEIPRPPQLWTSDATPERMGVLLADHGECMAWLSSEGGIFDLLAGRYSNGIPNLDMVLKAWSGDAERVDRGSRPPVYLTAPALTLGLSPQPDMLRGLATMPGFRGRGLLGRILYLLPPSPLGYRTLTPAPLQDGTRDAYAAGVRAMLDWPALSDDDGRERRYLLRLSPDARAAWLEFARGIEADMRPGGEFEHATDWAGKAPGQAARIAAVLHATEYARGKPWDAEISALTMTAALEIVATVAVHSLAALDLMGADPSIAAARKVWDWIERGRHARVTMRDAHQALRGTFPRARHFAEAIEPLEERGYVRTVDRAQPGGGRPSTVIEVRPDIAEGWR
ncbi:hypothetical protein TVNIR_2104 [Thioalkalivibrio nitratireducens DSM 14787]|uniref:DUF3987 domain-containing protein n=1 Tax=Thioalkalivibrio nitratireducens (strain DSM 14787 / UNIQEM 213 / ALEN2) TaxID=1255043 RepID=L0DVY8_THIND|nr:YfjI family protein [Thioalkalivibrio nitratireducens]AGA33764.1 hypothetical protein TVNIR_2104 [Thioalkalivibrio nitratireducens DSM 14787]